MEKILYEISKSLFIVSTHKAGHEAAILYTTILKDNPTDLICIAYQTVMERVLSDSYKYDIMIHLTQYIAVLLSLEMQTILHSILNTLILTHSST